MRSKPHTIRLSDINDALNTEIEIASSSDEGKRVTFNPSTGNYTVLVKGQFRRTTNSPIDVLNWYNVYSEETIQRQTEF